MVEYKNILTWNWDHVACPCKGCVRYFVSEYRKYFVCNKEKKFNRILHVFIKEWAFPESNCEFSQFFPSASLRNIVVRIQSLIYLSGTVLLFFLVEFVNLWVVVHRNFIYFYYFSTLRICSLLLLFHEQLSFLLCCDADPTETSPLQAFLIDLYLKKMKS